MQYAPAMAKQLGALHQRDRRTQADHARLVAQTRSTNSSSPRKDLSMPTLIAVQSLVRSLLLSPRAASITTIALALVASVLLGPDAVDAKGAIFGGR